MVEFATIYPGWYRGRTTHIHFKVFLDERTVLTGQIFFPDALSEWLYENAPAYCRDGTRDTLNADDGSAAQATRASYATVAEGDGAYLAQLVVGVDPAQAGARGPGGGRPPGPPSGGGGPGEQAARDAAARVQALLPGASTLQARPRSAPPRSTSRGRIGELRLAAPMRNRNGQRTKLTSGFVSGARL